MYGRFRGALNWSPMMYQCNSDQTNAIAIRPITLIAVVMYGGFKGDLNWAPMMYQFNKSDRCGFSRPGDQNFGLPSDETLAEAECREQYTQRNLLEILLNQTEIRLYISFSGLFETKQTSVWFQVNRKMINTICFQFNSIKFRKKFSVCILWYQMWYQIVNPINWEPIGRVCFCVADTTSWLIQRGSDVIKYDLH